MKIQTVTAGLILAAVVLMTAGCYQPWHHVEGNLDVQSEIRDLPPFERVYNEGNFDVYIIQDGTSEVEIEAESNLIPLIRTKIEGSALVIDTKDDLRNNYPMKIFVHTEVVEELRLSGSGYVEAEGLTTGDLELDLSGSGQMSFSGTSEDIEVNLSGSGSIDLDFTSSSIDADISGSGDIEAQGTTNTADLKISGSGSFHAYDLLIQDCHARISGSGSMYLTVEDYMYVNISGSGDVYYLGNPDLDIEISGSGSVKHP